MNTAASLDSKEAVAVVESHLAALQKRMTDWEGWQWKPEVEHPFIERAFEECAYQHTGRFEMLLDLLTCTEADLANDGRRRVHAREYVRSYAVREIANRLSFRSSGGPALCPNQSVTDDKWGGKLWI
jgi:hypothetical protein